jgi:serine phosphatase RsbU (regulator of sigma subunit)
MTELISIDDVAATSDDRAVRRRFDARNLVCLILLLVVFLFVTLIELLANLGRHNGTDVAIAASNFALILLMLFVMRDVLRAEKKKRTHGIWGVGDWVRRHLSATSVAYVIVQYSFFIAFTRQHEWIGWVMSFPLFLLGFRMLAAELVLMHVYVAGLGAAMALLGRVSKKEAFGIIIGTGVINLGALAIEGFTSYRMRKEIVADWRERRRHAQEQLRMREELHYAREIQLSMLPAEPPALDWIDLAGVSLPATEVGGDYFDYFVINSATGDRLAIVSGDVAGHGLAAGLVLAALRSGFTLLRDSLHDPADVLRRLHKLVCETTRRRTLVTCAVLLLDREMRRATFASAGHPPIVMGRDGNVECVNLFAPPLGVGLPLNIPQREMPFTSGDVFVLHTDGVYEATNDAGDNYGIERIEEVVRAHTSSRAYEICDAIVRDVQRFRGTAPQNDDVTVVVAKIA